MSNTSHLSTTQHIHVKTVLIMISAMYCCLAPFPIQNRTMSTPIPTMRIIHDTVLDSVQTCRLHKAKECLILVHTLNHVHTHSTLGAMFSLNRSMVISTSGLSKAAGRQRALSNNEDHVGRPSLLNGVVASMAAETTSIQLAQK